MTPDERAQRMLERLPAVLQSGPNLRRLFAAMGTEFEMMERATRRLLESRWYKLARGFGVDDSLGDKAASEIGSIGALVGLHPGSGETAEYFRQHIAALIGLHRRGLTTASAVLELVSFVYLAEQPPSIEVGDGVATGRFTVRDGRGDVREVRADLVDNPRVGALARFRDVEGKQQLTVSNGGLEQAFPSIELTASTDDVVVPLIHQQESGLDIIFLGTLKKGQTLRLRHDEPPLVEGLPPDGLVIVANPTRFAASATDDRVFHFDSFETRFSICEPSHKLPPLLLGETHWYYRTMPRSELYGYIGQRQDLAIHVTKALEDPPSPAIDLVFRWEQIVPAAFELRIPADYVPPHYEARSDGVVAFYRDIHAAIEYGCAAGIRATVAVMMPLVSEVVRVDDAGFEGIAEMSFVERPSVREGIEQIGPSIEFADAIDTPEETFTFGGVFDTTRYNGSRFQ